jgi:endoglucanase
MLRNSSKVSGIDYYLNPELQGLTPLECLDSIIGYAGLLGLRIVLSRMTATAKVELDDFWYIPNDEVYTPDLFKSDWVMLAQRYAGTAVVAADLWNDPSTHVTWGDGNEQEDWKLAAESVGNAILSVNPDWLIMIAGLTFNSWAGSNLAIVGVNPITLSSPNKLVYSVHEYTADTLIQPWFTDANFPATLRPMWDSNFGFLLRNNIAPVIVSGFGASFADSRDYTWFPLWMNYTQGQYSDDNVNDLYPGQFGMSWIYWALNPKGSIGGILNDNWETVDSRKMKYLSPHLAPMFDEFAASPTSAPYLTKFPSVQPVATSSASPTLPVFSYYHTNGSQIVDQSGKPTRLFGVNW